MADEAQIIKDVFASVFKGSKTTMTRAELKAVMTKLNPSLDNEGLEGLFNEMDQNKNGVIEYTEFVDFVCQLTEGDGEPSGPPARAETRGTLLDIDKWRAAVSGNGAWAFACDQGQRRPHQPSIKVEEPQRRSSKGDDSLMNELKAAAEYHTSHSEVSAFQQSAIRHCRHQLHQLSEEQNCMSEPYNNLGRYLDKCSATACLHEELQAVLQVQQNSQGDSNASRTDFAEGRLQWVEKAESTLQIQHDQLKYDLEEMRQHTKVTSQMK